LSSIEWYQDGRGIDRRMVGLVLYSGTIMKRIMGPLNLSIID
jgi:hypothetical protein